MWGKGIQLLLTITLVASTKAQGYGNLDDDFGGAAQQFPQNNQQISALPQYESLEQTPRQVGGFPNQGQGAAPPQYGPQQPGGAAPSGGGAGNPPWWMGQNAFQQPPGHPGVEQLAPSAQQPPVPPYGGAPPAPPYGGAPPAPGAYNPYGTGNPPPPVPLTTQQPYTPPQTPPPIPQEPLPQQFTDPPPIPQQTPSPNPYDPQPPPPPPQNPPQAGFGWNPPQSQVPSQNYNPPAPAPGCELVNKADCHSNRRNFNIPSSPKQPAPPPQNYQPPPQYQQPQTPYQPTPQQPYQPVPPPNQGYRPPPPQQQQPVTPSPYQPQPPQTPRPQNNPYQSNQLSSPNFQQPPRPQQQQRPYTPPQTPSRPAAQEAAPVPYPGCPAAMLCVQDEYCNAIGLIEENPIRFSAADRLHRVALMVKKLIIHLIDNFIQEMCHFSFCIFYSSRNALSQ